jgi:lipopolysaccharide export system protein LptA
MKLSATVKILLALFLGAFLWYVFINIQAPRTRSQPGNDAPELRRELLSRLEDVFLEIGNVSVTAAVQENYKNGEVHFRDFKMVQKTNERTVEVTGKVAQTRFAGTDIEFMEMQGDSLQDVHVISSDGLDLRSSTLNYVDSKKRIFTQTPVAFGLKSLTGTADGFSYNTENRVLELKGNVEAVYTPGLESSTAPAPTAAPVEGVSNDALDDNAEVEEQSAEESSPPEGDDNLEVETQEGEIKPIEQRPTEISCQRLVYDQSRHSVVLIKNVKLNQQGGLLRAERIDAELTEDNTQFASIVAKGMRGRVRDNSEVATPEDTLNPQQEEEPATLSQKAAGIKSLKSNKLTMKFTTGSDNQLSSMVAEGKAVMELEPTPQQRTEGKADLKRLSADMIEATIGPGGTGISNLMASSRKDPSRLRVEPLKPEHEAQGDQEERLPKTMTAPDINAEIDPKTGGFGLVLMSGGVELQQGDTLVTGSTARYNGKTDELQVDGKPILKDKAKQVSADHMLVTLGIGDLAADGSVRSTFYPPEDETKPYVFAIGEKVEDTSIAAGSLNLDYRNNVLRYTKGVRVIQGESAIDSDSLTIYMDESRMIATGKVRANLIVPKAQAEESAPAEGKEDTKKQTQQEETDKAGKAGKEKQHKGRRETVVEAEAGTTLLKLQSDLLEFDKVNGVLRLANNVQADESDMQITCQRLRYELGGEGRLRRSFAQDNVRVTIGPKVISGDKSEYYVAEQVLVVQGKNVKLEESGKLEANHQKLTFDIANDTLRFDARADQLLKTRITTN